MCPKHVTGWQGPWNFPLTGLPAPLRASEEIRASLGWLPPTAIRSIRHEPPPFSIPTQWRLCDQIEGLHLLLARACGGLMFLDRTDRINFEASIRTSPAVRRLIRNRVTQAGRSLKPSHLVYSPHHGFVKDLQTMFGNLLMDCPPCRSPRHAQWWRIHQIYEMHPFLWTAENDRLVVASLRRLLWEDLSGGSESVTVFRYVEAVHHRLNPEDSGKEILYLMERVLVRSPSPVGTFATFPEREALRCLAPNGFDQRKNLVDANIQVFGGPEAPLLLRRALDRLREMGGEGDSDLMAEWASLLNTFLKKLKNPPSDLIAEAVETFLDFYRRSGRETHTFQNCISDMTSKLPARYPEAVGIVRRTRPLLHSNWSYFKNIYRILISKVRPGDPGAQEMAGDLLPRLLGRQGLAVDLYLALEDSGFSVLRQIPDQELLQDLSFLRGQFGYDRASPTMEHKEMIRHYHRILLELSRRGPSSEALAEVRLGLSSLGSQHVRHCFPDESQDAWEVICSAFPDLAGDYPQFDPASGRGDSGAPSLKADQSAGENLPPQERQGLEGVQDLYRKALNGSAEAFNDLEKLFREVTDLAAEISRWQEKEGQKPAEARIASVLAVYSLSLLGVFPGDPMIQVKARRLIFEGARTGALSSPEASPHYFEVLEKIRDRLGFPKGNQAPLLTLPPEDWMAGMLLELSLQGHREYLHPLGRRMVETALRAGLPPALPMLHSLRYAIEHGDDPTTLEALIILVDASKFPHEGLGPASCLALLKTPDARIDRLIEIARGSGSERERHTALAALQGISEAGQGTATEAVRGAGSELAVSLLHDGPIPAPQGVLQGEDDAASLYFERPDGRRIEIPGPGRRLLLYGLSPSIPHSGFTHSMAVLEREGDRCRVLWSSDDVRCEIESMERTTWIRPQGGQAALERGDQIVLSGRRLSVHPLPATRRMLAID